MSKCGYPGCDWEGASRPYARKGLISVTEAIGFADWGQKSRSFAWAASEIAATTAVHDFDISAANTDPTCTRDHKIEPGLCKLCKQIRSEFDRRWREKTNLGSHVHHLAVDWANGRQIVSDNIVDPYLDNLQAFYEQYNPEWIDLEQTIRYEKDGLEYVGTYDAMATLNCPLNHGSERCVWLLDIKTSSSLHQLEWALQLSAYRWATYRTEWRKEKVWTEHIKDEMPMAAHCGAIWLRDEPSDPLVWLEVTSEVHERFLQLVSLAQWEKEQRKNAAQ